MTGKQLIALRDRLKLTQRELAVMLDRGERQIQHYEAGGTAIPRVVALACAAIALGLRDYPSA